MSSSAAPRPGLLFVISAPSGAGKTTVVDRLVQVSPRLAKSRSYTSRSKRAGETEGVDYNFISRQLFEEMIGRGEFLEWADVFGNVYGTARRDTDAILSAGTDLVLVIDVQGARLVRERVPNAVGIFVLPPSFAELEQRLRDRCQDSEPDIARRLATARNEIAAVDEYDYIVVNDDFDRCVGELAAIVTAERARRTRQHALVARIANTFRT